MDRADRELVPTPETVRDRVETPTRTLTLLSNSSSYSNRNGGGGKGGRSRATGPIGRIVSLRVDLDTTPFPELVCQERGRGANRVVASPVEAW